MGGATYSAVLYGSGLLISQFYGIPLHRDTPQCAHSALKGSLSVAVKSKPAWVHLCAYMSFLCRVPTLSSLASVDSAPDNSPKTVA